MLKTECRNYKNSIATNILTDDKTAKNYLAIAYSIVGVNTEKGRKYPGASTSCRAFDLYDISEKNKPSKTLIGIPNIGKRIKIKAENIITGEVKEFLGNEEAGDYTGVKKCTVAYYTSGRATKNAHTKNGWRFKKIK